MASFVGHALASLATARGMEKALPYGGTNRFLPWVMPVVLAVLPDLDVILVVLTDRMVEHRGASHSILAAIVFSVAASGIWKLIDFEARFLKVWGVLFAASCSHLVMDWLMGCGPDVKFLWPFTFGDWICPVQFIPTSFYLESFGGLLAAVTAPWSIIGMLLEVQSITPIILAIYAEKLWMKIMLLLLSLSGFMTTMVLHAWYW